MEGEPEDLVATGISKETLLNLLGEKAQRGGTCHNQVGEARMLFQSKRPFGWKGVRVRVSRERGHCRGLLSY